MKNQVITAVLDGLFKVGQIDPSHMSPDDDFFRDLSLSSEQLYQIICQVSEDLKMQNPLNTELKSAPQTPRQLVELFVARQNQPQKIAS